MNRLLYKTVITSYCRNYKMPLLISILTLIMALVLSIQIFSYYGNWENNVFKVEEHYGSFQFGLSDLSEQQKESIISKLPIEEHATYYEDIVQIDNKHYANLYTEPNYVKLSNVELIQGDFPLSQEEVLCENWFLMQNGYSAEDCIGKKIFINNKEYIISGVIADHWAQSVEGVYITTIVHNISFISGNENKFGIVCTFESGKLEDILSTIESELGDTYASHWYENSLLFSAAEMNINKMPSGTDFGLFVFSAFLYLFMLIVLLSLLSSIWLKYLNQEDVIYTQIGISKKILNLCKFIALQLIILGNLILGFLIPIFFSSISKFKFIVWAILICIFVSIIIVFSAFLMMQHKRGRIPSRAFSLSKIQAKKISFNKICYRLALKNIINSLSRILIICMSLIMGFLTFALGGHLLTIAKDANQLPSTYDYQIRFQDNYDNISMLQKYYKTLQSNQNIALTSIYLTSNNFRFNIQDLNDNVKSMLAKIDPKILATLENPSADSIRIPLLILGIDEDLSEKIGGENLSLEKGSNDCVLGIDNKLLYWKSEFNHEIEILAELAEENISMHVNGIQQIDFSAIGIQSNLPIVLVNINDYKSLFNPYLPTVCYCTIINDIKIENMLFQGSSMIQVIDMRENNAILMENYKQKQNLLHEFLLLLFATSLLSIFITIYSQYINEERQYTQLNAMGISKKYIGRIFIFELLIILLFSLLGGVLLSVIGSYVITCLITEKLYYIPYEIPIKWISAALLYMIGGMIISSVLLLLKIYDMKGRRKHDKNTE